MLNQLADNLNHLMANARISASELGRRTGLPAATIKKIRNGNNVNPTLSSLFPIAKYFTLTVSQLVGDEELPTQNNQQVYGTLTQEVTRLPLLNWKEIIAWPETKELLHDSLITEHALSDKAYAIKVCEEDWENFAKDTFLLIEPEIKATHRDYIIVHKIGQEIPTLKQLMDDEGVLYLKPVVPGYQMIPLTAEHQIVGVVIEYKKQLKTV